MRKLLLTLLILLPMTAWAALIEVDTTYRCTMIRHEDRVFGIALLDASPDETQNEVNVTEETKIWRVLKLKDGSVKEVPVTIPKFFTILRKGYVMRIHGGREWDGTLHAYEIWLKS